MQLRAASLNKATAKTIISPGTDKEFRKLADKYNNFSVKFLGNTHRKHLVSDQKFAIVSSFNWLSFKGDPEAQARDELGYLVTLPDDVDKLFADGIELLKSGYCHPARDGKSS